MYSPNLFDYATKELSQDAVICWLIAWAGTESKGRQAESGLCQCGRELLCALLSKWQFKSEEIVRTEVLNQEKHIDVLIRVNERHVILIEDKTYSGAHDCQLTKYQRLLIEGKTQFGRVKSSDLYSIYCKTGNYSLREREYAEAQGYRVFDRIDFLNVLKKYRGRNQILLDFRRHLSRWQAETDSFRQWTRKGKRTISGWEGFYRWIEENHLSEGTDDWGPLVSQVNGLVGSRFMPTETSKNSRFEIWVTEDTLSFRLWGAKRARSEKGMNREKQYWSNALVKQGAGRLTSPRRLEATKTKPMSVAVWRGWLAYGDDESLDLKRSLENLEEARAILVSTIRR